MVEDDRANPKVKAVKLIVGTLCSKSGDSGYFVALATATQATVRAAMRAVTKPKEK